MPPTRHIAHSTRQVHVTVGQGVAVRRPPGWLCLASSGWRRAHRGNRVPPLAVGTRAGGPLPRGAGGGGGRLIRWLPFLGTGGWARALAAHKFLPALGWAREASDWRAPWCGLGLSDWPGFLPAAGIRGG